MFKIWDLGRSGLGLRALGFRVLGFACIFKV